MALVGKPLVDIDIQSDLAPEDKALTTPPAEQAGDPGSAQQPQKVAEEATQSPSKASDNATARSSEELTGRSGDGSKGKSAALATPAMRHLIKEQKVCLY